MRQAYWIFATLLSHWRRHPLNLATLMVGLAIATALWSGVQALNQQARASYDRAAAVFGEAGLASIVSARGAFVAQDAYVALRRAGWKVSPVLEGSVRIGAASYRLIGVEPLTVPRGSPVSGLATGGELEAFLRAPGQTLAAPETLGELGVAEGATPSTDKGKALPPLVRDGTVAPGLLVVDIGAAQDILGRPGQLSRLIVDGDAAQPDAAALAAVAGDALRLEAAAEGGDLARLTDSFHLNLTAFGLLAFIVGLFIVHASIGLAFEQRLGTLRTMRAVGVPLRLLMAALVAEMVLAALLAGAVGMVCGYFIAAALLPDVAASLDGLYGAHVSGQLAIAPRWWASGLGMALAGALAASALSLAKVARLPVLSVAKPLAWREAQQVQLRRQGAFAVFCLVVALLAYVAGHGLIAGFVVIAGVLLGAALLLPLALSGLLSAGEGTAKQALAQWFWADTRQQLSGLSLALMALLLALSANVGVGTMVEGFRKTFTGWLDERLNAEIYFDAASAADGARIAAWLARQPQVSAVLPVWRAETRIKGWPVDVYGTRDHATYRVHFSLLSELPGAWDKVRDGEGVLVSEQLARRMGLGLGSTLAIPTGDAVWEAPVVGLYPDYGNPKGQVRVNVDHLVRHWPDARRTSYSLRTAPEQAEALIGTMQAQFGASLARVVDQASLKAASTRIFEKTFAVTGALNTLTLVVSGIALFASLLALTGLRLAQLAPVWALGVPRRRLADLEIGKLLVLAAITAVLAVPLGLVLAWCLVAIVNVQAFGWRLPFHVFPLQWVVILALALVTALLAAVIPVARLGRTAPQDLLRVFANER
ncbi:FtsX-like permease family protein [Hyphomicrobium sp.]|uniref:FtsX-like permease family protein n=1 Tax=Hyphomicrobium sp. TaxID=82 RepID=UPI0025C66C12|nr:FtsX-like permease family protein [Hyphomicrobium sp.]